MKKYLMTSTITIEVEDEDWGVFEALEYGKIEITDSRLTMVRLDTGEIIVNNLDITGDVDLRKYEG